jgi:small subunit ribosomal protein S17
MADEQNDTRNDQPEASTPAEPAAEPAPTETAPADRAPVEPAEQLPPKERRRRARSAHSGQARPARSPKERAAERGEARRKKAVARRSWRQRQRERRRAAGDTAGPAVTAPVAEEGGGRPRVRQGVVVSDKAQKTITIRIDVTRRHRTYKKIVRSSSTLHVHDERDEAHEGDTVRVVESRPLSARKRWRLVEVLERAR